MYLNEFGLLSSCLKSIAGIINPIYITYDKDYLIGIGRSGQKLCDTENGNLKPSFNVKIPGNVLEWILKIEGNDIKEQQENLEC